MQKFIHWLVGSFAVVALTLLLHFREDTESLERGSLSNRYIVSQIDFSFLDEEATALLKQEVTKEIGSVYAVDKAALSRKRLEIEKKLQSDQKWKELFPCCSFDKVYAVLESIEEGLLQVRQADEKTISRLKSLPFSSPLLFLQHSQEKKVSSELWDVLQEKVTCDETALLHYLLPYFQEESEWKLQKDGAIESVLKQTVQDAIPHKRTKVLAGTILVHPGEKVTERHLTMLQAMKKALSKQRAILSPALLSTFALAMVTVLLAGFYLRARHRDIFYSRQKLLVAASALLFTLLMAKGLEYATIHSGAEWLQKLHFPLWSVFPTLVLTILFGWEISLFAFLFLTVLLALSLPFPMDRFLILNFLAGLMTLLCARMIHRRKEIFLVCAKVFLGALPVVAAFNLWDHTFLTTRLPLDLVSLAFFLLFVATTAIGFLWVMEAKAGVMTPMTLMEYMDPSYPLLHRLSVEAPGTYHHSLLVGNLAECAAREIGANGLFCRVGALYHDVGKLFNPHYFSENELGGLNMHQLLTPLESAQVIISHVEEGEKLAQKHRLPAPLIEIIREHHGTQLVYYFFAKEVEQREGDLQKVDEKKFRYNGPKPRTKESAILMIADMVEAASRSLHELSEESIASLIDRLVGEKIKDGQFQKCQLTFEELGRVKKAMTKSLLASAHFRVKYPQNLFL